MTTFQGSVQEFHHHIGPRIRNVINAQTRKMRKEKNGICEFCGEHSELQSAHVHGRGRRTIIGTVLEKYANHDGVVFGKLDEIEAEIVRAHEPLEETFKFICQSCHVRYDSGDRNNGQLKIQPPSHKPIDPEFSKLYKIEGWAHKPHQINHKIIQAYLKLEKCGGVNHTMLRNFCMQNLSISTFDGNFASMKTDSGNSHGKIFYEEGLFVRIYEGPYAEIDKHFVLELI